MSKAKHHFEPCFNSVKKEETIMLNVRLSTWNNKNKAEHNSLFDYADYFLYQRTDNRIRRTVCSLGCLL